MKARDLFLITSLDDLLSPGETGDGFPETARLLQRVAADVPAYNQILREKAIDPASIQGPVDFADLPLLDKANYMRRFSQDELVMGGDRGRCDFYAVSSGSTGEPRGYPATGGSDRTSWSGHNAASSG